MSESKHTPGPWRTDTDIFHDRLDIRDESGRCIAVCIHDYPMSMARHDANANLIAAAPDLLDALEDFVIDVEGYFGFSETDDMEPEDDVAYFIGEYCWAKRLIERSKGENK